MDPPSSSSPRRDDAALQDELREIASQMELETQADVDVQSATDEAESGDEDGPRVGQGAWVDGRWHDPLDPHTFPQRESRSMEALDPDYEPEQRQVMNTRLITTKHSIRFYRLRIKT